MRHQMSNPVGRPQQFGPEIKARILELYKLGVPAARIARDMQVSRSTVWRVIRAGE
ncbi:MULTISPECIES: helix-turn-helix domain-containing protein [Enterobacteriaceae]|uniref:helix-turn-helix domain-containing protein n=2 Tax=Gammaproteobacteria TaxID=1236 RepID=UPI000908087C|nr:helix-turn-helix domain-containing protein [Salmonella enterica]